MTRGPVDPDDEFALVTKHWRPMVVAEVVRLEGEFVR